MLEMLLWCFVMSVPAFAANMIPIIGARWNWVPYLDKPLDGGAEVRGHRVFGTNKTWRGLILGGVIGVVIGLLYYGLFSLDLFIDTPLQTLTEFVAFGFLAGTGALLGDGFESFFKRQLGIKPGRPFIPFDQIDYLLGFLLLTLALVPWTGSQALIILLFGLVLNPLTNVLAYVFRIKKTYW